MGLSQQGTLDRACLVGIDRRTVLKLCAASVSTLVTGCATGAGVSYSGGEPVFRQVNPTALQEASGALARVLLSFLDTPTSNDMALYHLDRVLKETGLWESVLAGPVATVEQIGHTLLVNGGERGFLTLRVYNDQKFVTPLLIRRGVATERGAAMERAANSCMTEGSSTYNTAREVAMTDAQADDPCPGAGFVDIEELSRQPRDFFRLQDVVAYSEVIRQCAAILATPEDADVAALQEWQAEARQRFQLDRFYLGTRRDGDVVWIDWLILFANGAAAVAQVAKGKVQAVYSMLRKDERAALLAQVVIDSTPTETSAAEVDMVLPHVSLKP
ncbi:MAG: hypothetical protein AB7N91_23780 [Candidatus Tectimicrobiota bacterium]